MGALIDRGLAFLETWAGPLDWRLERGAGGSSYIGRFLVFDRGGAIVTGVHGRIVVRDRGGADIYLYDPPVFVKLHRHARCLQLLRPGDRWFKLHFEKPAGDFPSAYSYVELFLTEAYNSRR